MPSNLHVGVNLVLDLSLSELLFESLLGGGVQHLLAGVGVVGAPGEEDPLVAGAVIFVGSVLTKDYEDRYSNIHYWV